MEMELQYEKIGNYVLFKLVHADELGKLYRAGELGDEGWKRTVWLRVFDAEGIPREALAEQVNLVNEIGALKAVNVVANPHMDVEEGLPMLAWDYVPAQPLSSVFHRTRLEGFPVPPDNALLIVEKLALALSAALAIEVDGAPLTHGFLHPALVLVTNEGEALLSGFGLGDQLLGLLDHEESVASVAPYLAPEVLATRVTGKRSDVYSLGAILFELLTGRPLPAAISERESAVADARLALDDEPLPSDIAALLSRALAPRPEERFSSAADFKKELDKLLYGGNYAPTTFNLALFMDRLFRGDIEQEEKERLAEAEVDPTPYLAPPEPEPTEKKGGKGVVWAAVTAAVAIALGAALFVVPKMAQRETTNAPAQEEIEAKLRQEKQRRQEMEALIQKQLAELKQRDEEIQQLKEQLTKLIKERRTEEAKKLEEQISQREAEQAAARAKLEEQQRQLGLLQAAEETPTVLPTPTETPPTPTPEPTVAPAAVPTPELKPTPVPSPPTPTPTPQPMVAEGSFWKMEEVDELPQVIKAVPPRWPGTALRSRKRGVVIIKVTVDHKGKVKNARVLRADHKGFGIPRAALEAAKRYVFKPGTKAGVKVTTTATVTIRYDFTRR